jgi:anaerobic magnesium-protoporphyrin IX monomethyl ester cyclase
MISLEPDKMKIALVNPPTNFEQIYGDWDLSPLDTYTPPLGILSLAAFLRQHHHEPFIVDLMSLKLDLQKAIQYIISRNPDVIGLSAMTINCLNANLIAKELRKRGFSSPIVLGGAHISAVPGETLEAFQEIDFGVIGEGELTFLELLEKLERRQPVSEVAGVAWRHDNEHIIVNEPRPPITNLNCLPLPSWDLLQNFPAGYPSSLLESKRLPAAGIMTSRGCPFHCTFCDHRVFGSEVRHFSAEYTLRMIRHLINIYGIKDLMILDDNFLLNKKKLFGVCDGIILEKMDLTWYCITHVKSMTPDRLIKIKKAGCWFVEVGIESGNQDILKQIKKNTNKAEIQKAIVMAKRAGLKVKGNFIYGFPGETRETLEETIQFALDLDLDYFQQSYLTVWPGCEISYGLPKGERNQEEIWGKLAHQRITYIPKAMTEKQLAEASKDSFRRFYLRPKIIWRFMPMLASLRGIKFSIIALIVFLKTIFRKIPLR